MKKPNDITFVSAFNRTPEWIPQKSYEECALRLVRTLRKNGGKLRDSKVIFWIDAEFEPEEKYMQALADMDCVLLVSDARKIVLQSNDGSWSTKVYAIRDTESMIDTSHVAWIDADYYVNGDLSELLSIAEQVGVSAPPMNLVTNFGAGEADRSMWEAYYRHFEINLNVLDWPEYKVRTHVDKMMSFFYFTSSLITWKRRIGFEESYAKIALELFDSGLPFCQKRYNQTAIPMTILKNDYSWNSLPRHLAYMYHLNGYKLDNGEQEPKLIHYCCNKVHQLPDFKQMGKL